MKTFFSVFVPAWALLSPLALASCSSSYAIQPSGQAATTQVRKDSGSTSCVTMTCVYDYSYKSSKVQITSYASDATGDVAPINQITGKKAGLYHGFNTYDGIAIGPDHKIYVFNCGNGGCDPAIYVFAAGASGNVKPIAQILGSNTGLINGYGYVAVDNDSNIYAATSSYGEGAITVYAAGSNGNVTPTQNIAGSSTLLSGPTGIAVDAAHNIYVTDPDTAAVLVYAAGSTGNVAPIKRILH